VPDDGNAVPADRYAVPGDAGADVLSSGQHNLPNCDDGVSAARAGDDL